MCSFSLIFTPFTARLSFPSDETFCPESRTRSRCLVRAITRALGEAFDGYTKRRRLPRTIMSNIASAVSQQDAYVNCARTREITMHRTPFTAPTEIIAAAAEHCKPRKQYYHRLHNEFRSCERISFAAYPRCFAALTCRRMNGKSELIGIYRAVSAPRCTFSSKYPIA